MDINFTDLFKKESQDKFSISTEEVENTINNPSKSEEIAYEGLSLKFYTKANGDKLLLVLGREISNQITIDLAFRIKPDLDKKLAIFKPAQILEKLIDRFGLEVEIGETKSKFILANEISIKPGEASNLVKVNNSKNHLFTTSMFIKINEDKTKAQCALVFALDVDSYLEWIGK